MSEDETKEGMDDEAEETQHEDPEVPIDFSTFILSLSSSAAFHLGLAPHPEEKCECLNLPMAKQTIDIISLLQEKLNFPGIHLRLPCLITHLWQPLFLNHLNRE